MKQKDRLAAVSPKYDQVFLSGGCEGRHRYADTADGRCVVKIISSHCIGPSGNDLDGGGDEQVRPMLTRYAVGVKAKRHEGTGRTVAF